MKRKFGLAALVAILGTLMVVGVVLAITITVDGNPTDWPGDPTCTIGNSGCAKMANDPQESLSTTMPISQDIATFWATNNTTTAFFRFDTYSNTSYAAGAFVRICIDTLVSGGQTNVGGCSGLNTNKMIMLRSASSNIFDCNTVDCNDVFAIPSGSATRATSGTVTEVSAALATLGITTNSTLHLIVFFDNNALPPDDNVPDTGSISWCVGSGCPTAITLSSLSAKSETENAPSLILLGTAVLGLGTLVLIIRRRQVRSL